MAYPYNQGTNQGPYNPNYPINQGPNQGPYIPNYPTNQGLNQGPYNPNYPINQGPNQGPYNPNNPTNQGTNQGPYNPMQSSIFASHTQGQSAYILDGQIRIVCPKCEGIINSYDKNQEMRKYFGAQLGKGEHISL